MWLPILSHADGYGFTYGARVSFVGALGKRSRLSVPLTWGGERRAARGARTDIRRPGLDCSRGAVSEPPRESAFELPDVRVGRARRRGTDRH